VFCVCAGNVVELAVAVVLGTAFTELISSATKVGQVYESSLWSAAVALFKQTSMAAAIECAWHIQCPGSNLAAILGLVQQMGGSNQLLVQPKVHGGHL
jgi:hypothetical protein